VHAGRTIAFSFRERMVGPMARGEDNPHLGAARGGAQGTQLVGNFVITIDDLAACIAAPDHPARLSGTVSFVDLADETPITVGAINLYAADRETGLKQMRYRLGFRGMDGADYLLAATKFIRPRRATVKEQVTAYARLFVAGEQIPEAPLASPARCTVPTGAPIGPEDGEAGRVVAAGILVFRLRDLPAFILSMRTEGASRAAGLLKFLAFSRRELTTPVPVLAT